MAYDAFIETITPIPESPCASDSVNLAPKVQIINGIENHEQVADERRHSALSKFSMDVEAMISFRTSHGLQPFQKTLNPTFVASK
jgi:hypothetical protein